MNILENETRKKNRNTVKTYMHSRGKARLERHKLFVEEGEAGLWTSDKGTPVATKGRDKLAKPAEWSLKCFPDWEWYNIEIYETQNPNFFWVECDGRGKICFEGYPEGYYSNHFLHSFELFDGKIVRQREFMNPIEQMRALGIDTPTINRIGFPTD